MTSAIVGSTALRLYLGTERVIGQERARRQLAVMLARQIEVAKGRWSSAESAIIAGWTGSGKTYLARMMCEQCGLPFTDANSTQYTESGYAGDDLSQMYLPLLESAARQIDAERGEAAGPPILGDRDAAREPSVLKRPDIDKIAERAATGVVLLDEMDKWCHRQNHQTGRLDTAIQAELLKMVEGSQVYVTDNEDEVGILFDTSRVLLLCAGAFVGLSRQVFKRLDRPVEDPYLGFLQLVDHDLIEQADFVRYGLIPELAGRLSKMIFLRPLSKEHLAQIVMAEGGPIDELRQRFIDVDCEWRVPDVAITHLADVALRKEVGARGLETVLWRAFGEALFEAGVAEGPTAVSLAVNQPKAQVVMR